MCSQRVSDALVGIAVDTYYQCSGGVIGWNTARTVLEAVLAAMPAAEPTTSEPDDDHRRHVWDNISGLEQADQYMRQRLVAHDAALAEVRDEMQALRSEYSMHVMVPLDEYDRLAAVDPFAVTPTAVPDAVRDVTKDRAHWFARGYREGARFTADLTNNPQEGE